MYVFKRKKTVTDFKIRMVILLSYWNNIVAFQSKCYNSIGVDSLFYSAKSSWQISADESKNFEGKK